MKKIMMTVWAVAASLTLAAGIVEETNSQPMLAVTARMAPFGEVTQKVASLGTMIGNPIVPTLLLTAGQQQLVDRYGRLRADAPITWFAYVQTPALEIAATNLDQVAIEDLFGQVLVYPISDGPATMLLNHPGATKAADGTIHILPGKKNPDDLYVRYTADSRYCAFASSPALAAKALADFAALSARWKTEQKSSLLRFEVAERGVTALSTLWTAMTEEPQAAGTNNVPGIAASLQGSKMNKVKDLLDSIASCTLVLDVDQSGLTLESFLQPKPGRKTPFASDFALPKGALDHVPASTPFFYFSGDRFGAQCSDEATFRADMATMGDCLVSFLSQLAEEDDNAKYKPFLKDIGSVVSQMLKTLPFPGATDWTGLWLALDEKSHPFFEGVRQSVKTTEIRDCSRRAYESLAAAVEKQWPGKNLLVQDADNMTVDLAALLDICAAEAGVKPGDKEAKELANVKKKIVRVLGGDKLAATGRYEGNMVRTRVSALGVKSAANTSPTGEARLAAALPEAAAKRPAAVFSLELYALVRDAVLPIMARLSPEMDAKQYKAVRAAMPPPEANSALACASWADSNGAIRTLLRITSGELKNFGAAFNAFTAASLIGAEND